MAKEQKKADSSKGDMKPHNRQTFPVPSPPDGGWGWMVTLSSFMISVLVDGVCFSQGIFFNRFMDHFGTNKATTSVIGSVLNGSYLIIGPFVSMLVNTYGCRPTAFAGAVLSCVAIFVSTFAPNIQVFIFLYSFLGGTGFGLMYLPAMVMVGYYFDKKRALATGIACCGSGIGMFVFAPLSELLLGEYNWRGATWIMSSLVLNAAIFSLFYRPLSVGSYDNPEIQMDELNSTGQAASQNSDKYQITNGKLTQPIIERCRSFETNLNKPPNKLTDKLKEGSDLARLAHSHDAFQLFQQDSEHHNHKHHYLHPMERKDIFYSGSVRNLKEFTEAGSTSEFTKTMMRSNQSLHSSQDNEHNLSLRARAGRVMLSLFDVTLLKSPTFLVYGLSCFLCMLGFFIPFTYIPPMAVDLNIPRTDAAFLISIIGISNTIGRVGVGFISDRSWADCLLINNLALIIAGSITILVPYYPNYGLLSAYVATFGLGIAVFVSLRSIIMVELMGLERLTNAFGLVIMCQGLSSYIGAPIAGSIADLFGSYDAAFYLSGAALALSGMICLPLRRISAWEKRRDERNKNTAETDPMIEQIGTLS